MDRYVVGFCIETRSNEVILIQKKKPDWQRGKLNGVGGKINPNESDYLAMVREYHEETGVVEPDWDHFLTVNFGGQAEVVFFVARCDISMANTVTDEKIIRAHVEDVLVNQVPGHQLIPNIPWLLAMALSGDKGVMTQQS